MILVADDDPQSLASTRKILELAGLAVEGVADGLEALDRVRAARGAVEVVVTDVRMPKLGGIPLIRALAALGPPLSPPVVLMTGYGRVEDAVQAMKLGAVDFLMKPFRRQQLLEAVEAARRRSASIPVTGQDLDPNARSDQASEEGWAGDSLASHALRETIAKVAPTQATVLITGESGSGKELAAREIHRVSGRGPWVAVNCASIPESLLESELFGHEKGAFTGAVATKEGLFAAASGGTLLLDEIGEMSAPLQAKLLRAIEEGEIRPLGGTRPRRVNTRLLASTNRDLGQMAQEGRFRRDLLYRLEVVTIAIPPLRERPEDIAPLSERFLARASGRHAKGVTTIAEPAKACLLRHPWPGNARELANAIERAVIFASGDRIEVGDLPAHLRPDSEISAARLLGSVIPVPLGTPLKEVGDLLIRKTLEATDGDKGLAASLLGINSRTIYRKLEKDRGEVAKDTEA